MDLRTYYEKIRNAEALIEGEFAVLVSEVTSEGGKAGVFTEAPKNVAARMIAEGRARLAGDAEATRFRAQLVEAKERFDREEAARRMQVMVVPAPDSRLSKDRS